MVTDKTESGVRHPISGLPEVQTLYIQSAIDSLTSGRDSFLDLARVVFGR